VTALKDWRTRLGLSQRDAAKRLGITLQTYQDLENGVTMATGKPRELDVRTRLACAAIEKGVEPI
jgi:transcriptional regulator with XRE-family HTH domain